MLSTQKVQQFKTMLQARIVECERVLANAEEETRANAARHADTADQAAAETKGKHSRTRQILRDRLLEALGTL